MSIIFNSADMAETMNNGVSNVTGADSTITENYTNVVQHGIKIDVSVSEKTISGTPPLTFNSNGTPLLDYLISGNMSQTGTPTPDNPIQPQECGDLETTGVHAGQYKIPISSAGYTNNIYLGEVPTTRKIRKLVLTGAETDWSNTYGESLFRLPILNTVGLIGGISSHFSFNPIQSGLNAELASGEFATQILRLQIVLFFKNTACTSVSMWKTYLQEQYANGTPVTIWYVLAEPTTGIVNEPLMKIGDYADSVSYSQAGVTIPTAVGNNTIDVQTTLKPSNISITYKGR